MCTRARILSQMKSKSGSLSILIVHSLLLSFFFFFNETTINNILFIHQGIKNKKLSLFFHICSTMLHFSKRRDC